MAIGMFFSVTSSLVSFTKLAVEEQVLTLTHTQHRCSGAIKRVNHVVNTVCCLCGLSYLQTSVNNLQPAVVFLLPDSEDSQDEDYSSRWRSIRIMYFTMFLSSVGEDACQCSVKMFQRKVFCLSLYVMH